MGEWVRVKVQTPDSEVKEKRFQIEIYKRTLLDLKRIGIATPGYLELRSTGVVLKSIEGGVRLSNRECIGTEVLLKDSDVWTTPSFTIEFVRVPTEVEAGRIYYEDDEKDRMKRAIDFSISFVIAGLISEFVSYSLWKHFSLPMSFPWGVGFVVGGFSSLMVAAAIEVVFKPQQPILKLFRYSCAFYVILGVAIIYRFGALS